jgi:hypothetical protein
MHDVVPTSVVDRSIPRRLILRFLVVSKEPVASVLNLKCDMSVRESFAATSSCLDILHKVTAALGRIMDLAPKLASRQETTQMY